MRPPEPSTPGAHEASPGVLPNPSSHRGREPRTETTKDSIPMTTPKIEPAPADDGSAAIADLRETAGELLWHAQIDLSNKLNGIADRLEVALEGGAR